MNNQNADFILQPTYRLTDIRSQMPEKTSILDWEKVYPRAGILIWYILEDRIFLSDGFCELMGLSRAGLLNLELLIRLNPDCEMRRYLRGILDRVCSSEFADTSFRTQIPGIRKEIYGSVQLLDMEAVGVLDLMVICWE